MSVYHFSTSLPSHPPPPPPLEPPPGPPSFLSRARRRQRGAGRASRITPTYELCFFFRFSSENPTEKEMTLFKHRAELIELNSSTDSFNNTLLDLASLGMDSNLELSGNTARGEILTRGGETPVSARGRSGSESTFEHYNFTPSLLPPRYGNGGRTDLFPSASSSNLASSFIMTTGTETGTVRVRPRRGTTHSLFSTPTPTPPSATSFHNDLSNEVRPPLASPTTRNRAATFRSIFTTTGTGGRNGTYDTSTDNALGGGAGIFGTTTTGAERGRLSRLVISAPLSHTLGNSSFSSPFPFPSSKSKMSNY